MRNWKLSVADFWRRGSSQVAQVELDAAVEDFYEVLSLPLPACVPA